MSQTKVIKRIEEICNEFDARMKVVGVAIARLELAKALAESEAAQQGAQSDGKKSVRHVGLMNDGVGGPFPRR